jgi:hypothetical protein
LVSVGFVVEGPSDKKLIENKKFETFLRDECNLALKRPIVDAGGNGKMCQGKISDFVNQLRKKAEPDKIIVLADLDPEECAPCITKRKAIIGEENIDLVAIARKAMEAWFLADTQAMCAWLGQADFYEECPEQTPQAPWYRLKEIAKERSLRGPGQSKPVFANRFIRDCDFDLLRAAKHPNCPSARYFVEHLRELA